MAVNGYKIFDSDTHVGPSADILERYMSVGDLDKLSEFADFQSQNRRTGHTTYNFNTRQYTRRLGDPEARPPKAGEYLTGLTAQHRRPPNVLVEDDPAERIKDLDVEGVDVNLLLPSGWFGVWTSQADLALENSMYSAYHQWMEDYCSPFPDRLTGSHPLLREGRGGGRIRSPAVGQVPLGYGRVRLRSLRQALGPS